MKKVLIALLLILVIALPVVYGVDSVVKTPVVPKSKCDGSLRLSPVNVAAGATAAVKEQASSQIQAQVMGNIPGLNDAFSAWTQAKQLGAFISVISTGGAGAFLLNMGQDEATSAAKATFVKQIRDTSPAMAQTYSSAQDVLAKKEMILGKRGMDVDCQGRLNYQDAEITKVQKTPINPLTASECIDKSKCPLVVNGPSKVSKVSCDKDKNPNCKEDVVSFKPTNANSFMEVKGEDGKVVRYDGLTTGSEIKVATVIKKDSKGNDVTYQEVRHATIKVDDKITKETPIDLGGKRMILPAGAEAEYTSAIIDEKTGKVTKEASWVIKGPIDKPIKMQLPDKDGKFSKNSQTVNIGVPAGTSCTGSCITVEGKSIRGSGGLSVEDAKTHKKVISHALKKDGRPEEVQPRVTVSDKGFIAENGNFETDNLKFSAASTDKAKTLIVTDDSIKDKASLEKLRETKEYANVNLLQKAGTGKDEKLLMSSSKDGTMDVTLDPSDKLFNFPADCNNPKSAKNGCEVKFTVSSGGGITAEKPWGDCAGKSFGCTRIDADPGKDGIIQITNGNARTTLSSDGTDIYINPNPNKKDQKQVAASMFIQPAVEGDKLYAWDQNRGVYAMSQKQEDGIAKCIKNEGCTAKIKPACTKANPSGCLGGFTNEYQDPSKRITKEPSAQQLTAQEATTQPKTEEGTSAVSLTPAQIAAIQAGANANPQYIEAQNRWNDECTGASSLFNNDYEQQSCNILQERRVAIMKQEADKVTGNVGATTPAKTSGELKSSTNLPDVAGKQGVSESGVAPSNLPESVGKQGISESGVTPSVMPESVGKQGVSQEIVPSGMSAKEYAAAQAEIDAKNLVTQTDLTNEKASLLDEQKALEEQKTNIGYLGSEDQARLNAIKAQTAYIDQQVNILNGLPAYAASSTSTVAVTQAKLDAFCKEYPTDEICGGPTPKNLATAKKKASASKAKSAVTRKPAEEAAPLPLLEPIPSDIKGSTGKEVDITKATAEMKARKEADAAAQDAAAEETRRYDANLMTKAEETAYLDKKWGLSQPPTPPPTQVAPAPQPITPIDNEKMKEAIKNQFRGENTQGAEQGQQVRQTIQNAFNQANSPDNPAKKQTDAEQAKARENVKDKAADAFSQL